MHESNVGASQLRQSFAEQLGGLRKLEQQAKQLFTDLAVESMDEAVTSLLRTAAADTTIQLARLDRLVRTSGRVDNTRVGCVSVDDRAANSTLRMEKSGNQRGDVDDGLFGSACRSLQDRIAGYESACAVARQLEDYAALDVLLQCLDEELATTAALFDLRTRRTPLLRAV